MAEAFRIRYRKILKDGLVESPASLRKDGQKRGKIAQTKDHNLLIRLRDFETEVLRFMTNELVPFTNNRSEQRLRMIKVQQKISGCFRSIEGAKKFCLIRSFLLTAEKHGVKPTEAIAKLFAGKLPDVFTSPAIQKEVDCGE